MRYGKVIFAGVLSCVMAVSAIGVTTQAKPKEANFKLNKSSIVISKDKSFNLSIKKLGKNSVVWTVSDKTIAEVKNGKVTGLKAGKTVVNAKISNVNKSLKCKVTVEDPYFDSNGYTISEDDEDVVLELVGTSRKIKWSSSDEDILEMEPDGTMFPIEAGTVTVTATLPDGFSVSTTVTVTPGDDSDDDDDWDDDDWDDDDDDDDWDEDDDE